MKPASFQYKQPKGQVELLKLLGELGDDAKIIAGGQSLVPMMNMRLARPEIIIDINQISELDYIRRKGNRVEIGTLTRQMKLEESELLKEYCPVLPFAVSKIGHYAIRQRGTVGGSIAHADPSAELPLMALLLDSHIHIISENGERLVPAEEFFISIYTTELMPDELLKSIDFRLLEKNERWAYQDFTRRAGDFSIVSVGCLLQMDENKKVTRLRVVVGGVDIIPRVFQEELKEHIGMKLNEHILSNITETIIDDLDPNSDLHATAEYRIDLLRKMIPDTIKKAYEKNE